MHTTKDIVAVTKQVKSETWCVLVGNIFLKSWYVLWGNSFLKSNMRKGNIFQIANVCSNPKLFWEADMCSKAMNFWKGDVNNEPPFMLREFSYSCFGGYAYYAKKKAKYASPQAHYAQITPQLEPKNHVP